MLEEKFKESLTSAITDYSQKGMSIGTQYYILKDVFSEMTTLYQQYIAQSIEKINQETATSAEGDSEVVVEEAETTEE